MKRLPPSELNIMVIVWEAKEPVNVSYIAEHINNEIEITASALHSYLARLVEKGFLHCKKQKKLNLYYPLITESEYQKLESNSILKVLYKGSLTDFVATLYKSDSVSKNDLQELKNYIEQFTEDE